MQTIYSRRLFLTRGAQLLSVAGTLPLFLDKFGRCMADDFAANPQGVGRSDKVLVVMCGEFSRTPRMNNGGNGGAPLSMGTPGRDHWGNAMFCVLGGGGVKGGRIFGSTNRLGEVPRDKPVEPCDIHATIYHVLGVDPSISFLNNSGRPIPALDRGQVLRELL